MSIISGGIWRTTPIDQTPEISLSNWRIYEVENGDRHFVGYNDTEHEGRVSSKIVSFDEATLRGVTRSGRVYQLVGDSGRDGDADYVWSAWRKINSIETFKDVSDSVTTQDRRQDPPTQSEHQ